MTALGLLLVAQVEAHAPLDGDDRFTLGDATQPVPDAPWWADGDDSLRALIEEGIATNTDLSGAVARVQQAEGAFWQTRSLLLPTVDFDVTAASQPVNPGSFVPASAGDVSTQNTLQMGLRGRYEIDVFGRNVLATRASRYDRLAFEGDRDAIAVAIAVRVGEAYYDLATARVRFDVVTRQLQTNRELLELLELRRDAAAAGTVDVLQQRQLVAALEATLPSAEAAVDLTAFRLAVLLGRDGVTDPIETGDLPEPGDPPAVGHPGDLLENRPDLRAADERATSARSRATAAMLGFLPTLQANAQLGYFSIWWGSQTPPLFPAYQVSAQLSVPVFGGGRRHGVLRSARGSELAASEAWRGAVLVAQQEVEGALLQDKAARARLTATQASEELARASYERSREQWLEGVTSYLTVFTNLGAWQRAELEQVGARRDAAVARIRLRSAVGGPWTRDLGAREAR